MAKEKPPDNSQKLFQTSMLSLFLMKRLLAFIVLFIYTCVSTGFTVSTHICMNKQQSVQLGAVKDDVCNKCGMHTDESNGCCRDEVQVIKLQQDTQVAKILAPALRLYQPVLALTQYLLSPFFNFLQSTPVTTFQPPPLPGEATYLTNCVFRI